MSAFFGSKPKVPQLTKLDLGTEQTKAIGANQTSLAQNESLVDTANTFSRSEIDKMMQQIIPGYSGMRTTAASNIADELGGKIPQDVQDAIERSTAAKTLGLGVGGSGVAKDLTARDLGMTSLNLTQQGLSSAEKWMQESEAMYSPGMTSVTASFVSPGQMYSTDNEQNVQQFNRQWMQNLVSAAPDPVASGVLNTTMQMFATMRGSASPNNTTKNDNIPSDSVDSSMDTGGGNGPGIDFSDGTAMEMGGGFEGTAIAG